jgi:hypothetical protein
LSAKRKTLEDSGTSTETPDEERPVEAAKPSGKTPRVEAPVHEDENEETLATPQIQLSRKYPPKDKEIEKLEDRPETALLDSSEKIEKETQPEHARASFSMTCPPEKRMKQTPGEEDAGKRFWDHYEKTGELCGLDFPKYDPIKAVVGLVDIISEDEELSYIDEDVMMETDKTDPRLSAPENRDLVLAENADLSKGLEAKSPIDLDSGDAGV